MHSLHRRLPPIAAVVAIATTIAACCAAGGTAAAAARTAGPLTGTWQGTYGGAYHGKFTLHWTQTGSRLSGTINLSTAGRAIVKGNLRGSRITFGTVGSTVITYSGSVSGKSMSGSYHTPGGGGAWHAHKVS